MIKALYQDLIAQFPTIKWYFVQALNAKGKYAVLKIIDPAEGSVKETFCDTENVNMGEYLIQVDYIGEDTISSYEECTTMKDYVRTLKSVTDGVKTYQIYKNTTDGVRVIEDATLNTWLTFFESTLTWKEL